MSDDAWCQKRSRKLREVQTRLRHIRLVAVLSTVSLARWAGAQPANATVMPSVTVIGTNGWGQDAAQQQPQAVSSFPVQQLEDAGIFTVLDFRRLIPNFSQAHTGIRSYADTYALRGIANTEFLSDPAVVLYVDDVSFGDGVGYATDLVAIDHVEVFRGPQGSRFGKNAEAGVINIVTRPPTDRLEAEAKASWATFNTQQYQASTLGPLVKDKLFFGLAGQYLISDGFVRNTFLHSRADTREGLNGRAVLRWIPAGDWTMDFTVTGEKFNDGFSLTPLNGRWRETMSDFDGKYDQTLNSESLRVRGELAGVALTSVTARREFRLDPFLLDPDFSPITGNTGVNTWVQTQWTEELRVQPVLPPEPWNWRAGVFFSTTDSEIVRIFDFVFPPPGPAGRDVVIQKQDFNNYAVFGEVTRTFREFEATFGLRVDYAAREWDGSRMSTFGPPPSPLDEERDYFNAAPKLTLAYHFTDAIQIYGSTGLGFKPGGFSAFINDPALREFKTETVWANELGLKSAWLGGKLTANAALFYYDVEDYQVEQFGPGLSVTVANAPRAHTMGVELELAARPAEAWEFSGFFGYTDARLVRYTNPFNGATVRDTHPQGVAEFNGGVAAQYRHRGGFFGRVAYAAVGDMFYDAPNSVAFKQSAYGVLSARLGYEHGHFGVFLFGENLADTHYFTKKTEALNAGAPGHPRTFGAMVTAWY